jgi:hypothetical protein
MKNGELPVNEIDNILTHPTIKFNFDAPILYVHVFILLNTNQSFTTNEHDKDELDPEMQIFEMPMREVQKF